MINNIHKIAQKYKNTCKIHYDYENSLLIWIGTFKNYKTIYTRSEKHQRLKLDYGTISMKITYARIPEKTGFNRNSVLFKLPTFIEINGNSFKILDVLKTSNKKEIQKIENIIKDKLYNNKNVDITGLKQNTLNLLKTSFLSYTLFSNFLIFLESNYKDLYNIIIDYNPHIEKEDIEDFFIDSDQIKSIEVLNKALEKAISEEDYERASDIKKQIENLKHNL